MHKLKLDSAEVLAPAYAARCFSHEIPKYRLPHGGMSAEAATAFVAKLKSDGRYQADVY